MQSSWETYTKCDPRPDAASEKALNTFLSQGADEEARASTTLSAGLVAHSWFVYEVVVAVVVVVTLVVLVLLPMLLRLWLTVSPLVSLSFWYRYFFCVVPLLPFWVSLSPFFEVIVAAAVVGFVCQANPFLLVQHLGARVGAGDGEMRLRRVDRGRLAQRYR